MYPALCAISSVMEKFFGLLLCLGFDVWEVDVVAGEESIIGGSLWHWCCVDSSVVGCYVSFGELSLCLDSLEDWSLDNWGDNGLNL